jgi:hypothetical protein
LIHEFGRSYALRSIPTKFAKLTPIAGRSAFPVTAFYKGESQGKKLSGDWKERTCSLSSPAHVMLRGSGGVLFLQIHFSVVTTPSACDANKQVVAMCQPWFYLRLVAYSFFWLSEGAYGLSRDWRCSKHTLRLNAVMDTHPRTRASEEPKSSPEMNLGMKSSRPGAQAAC